MKNYILGVALLLAVLIAPTLSQAQTTSLSSSQINAIIQLLQSFGASQSIINNVQLSLSGGTPTTGRQSFCYNFSNDLTVGSGGADVLALNQAFSLSGINTTGNSSSFTENNAGDVVSFQRKYGIRQTGYVGPITRAKLNQLYGCVVVNPSTADFSVSPTIPQTGSSITVTAPNGGETWTKGTIRVITWRGTPSAQGALASTYDIALVPYYPPCTSNICPAYPYAAPFTIGKGVKGSSYNWSVVGWGVNQDNKTDISDGSYTIRVCQTGSSNCDSSDSYFKIVSNAAPGSTF